MAFLLKFVLASFLFMAAFDHLFGENNSSAAKFPPGDPRNCFLPKGVYRFEVIPGSGWDNLRNQHMGLVFGRNYSECKTSEDGKFLIPDNMVLYPVKKGKLDAFADLYDHWNNYSSLTARSINLEASASFAMFSISGSYSSEHQSVKRHQVEDKSATTRVQIRHNLYMAKLQPDSALHPAFKSRLLAIASYVQGNNSEYANFLAEILVRDFGTHYITSINAGAVIAKVDQLAKKYVGDMKGDKSKVTAAASASFFKLFGGNFSAKFGFSHATGEADVDAYIKNTVYSTVYTIGGTTFTGDFTASQWENQLLDELVATDRSGDPLHYAITPGSLPEVSGKLVFKVAEFVLNAAKTYYETNTIKGCTKMDSPDFRFQANQEDGSCESPFNNYTFGGVFQTCLTLDSGGDWQLLDNDPCESLSQKNPLTSAFTCSYGYEKQLLYKDFVPRICRDPYCYNCYRYMRRCEVTCTYARYETYWCVAKGSVPRDSGYLFGGIYNDEFNNPLTQARSCPHKFYPLLFAGKMRVCVSDDYELGFQRSVPFGGFFSCHHGNPLAVGQSNLDKFATLPGPPGLPQTCPIGYSQHLTSLVKGCAIHYCVKSHVFNSLGLPTVRRPPYSSKAPLILNYTVPMHLVNEDTGQVWFKTSTSPTWILATKSSMQEYAAQNNMNEADSGDMSAGAAAGLTFGVTAAAGLLIAAGVLYGRRRIYEKVPGRSGSTQVLNPESPTYQATAGEGNSRV